MYNEKFLKEFGARVRQRRIEIDMTQDELAKRLGYSNRTSVCHIENGARNLTTEKAMVVAEALDTTIEWLMDGDEDGGDDYDILIEKITNDCSKDRLMEYAIALMEAAKNKAT